MSGTRFAMPSPRLLVSTQTIVSPSLPNYVLRQESILMDYACSTKLARIAPDSIYSQPVSGWPTTGRGVSNLRYYTRDHPDTTRRGCLGGIDAWVQR